VERAVTDSASISTDRLIHTLEQLIALPGSPGHPEELAAIADTSAALMRAAGLRSDIIPTSGAPLVVGRRSGRAPFSLMFYHHYDVASTGPWRSWDHDPCQLSEREGMLYGRGVADGKGPLAAHLHALASLIDAEGELPCGVVVVAEGDALAGSPFLPQAIVDHRELLRADACLATGGDRDAHGRPFCYSGSKGMLQVRLRADGAAHALPAGLATSVPNPLWRLLWALTQIKSDQEEILIEDFYETIEGPDRNDSRALRAAAFDEEIRLSAWNMSQMLFGMSGGAVIQAETTLPTCNVSIVHVESAGDLAHIPTSASARLDFQLVPRQQPQVVHDLLCAHLEAKGLADISVVRLPGGYPPAATPLDDPFIQWIGAVGQHVYGGPLTVLPRGAFAMPLTFFQQAFGMPVATIACAQPDSAFLAPNEHIALEDLVNHGQLAVEILRACAQNTIA
jgi:acetylornithine deacetylase/succinyl-diaminopimelate desuccinylase-like protein